MDGVFRFNARNVAERSLEVREAGSTPTTVTTGRQPRPGSLCRMS
jgi:hypothetical protein